MLLERGTGFSELAAGDTVDGDTVYGDTVDGDTVDGDTVDGDTVDGFINNQICKGYVESGDADIICGLFDVVVIIITIFVKGSNSVIVLLTSGVILGPKFLELNSSPLVVKTSMYVV